MKVLYTLILTLCFINANASTIIQKIGPNTDLIDSDDGNFSIGQQIGNIYFID
jgi:hypothetical protein